MGTTPEEIAGVRRVFGERVRAARTDLGYTLRGLAERAGVHWTYLGQVERGERNISLFTILRIAAALGLDPAALVTGMIRPAPTRSEPAAKRTSVSDESA